jgi:hypothetical protein
MRVHVGHCNVINSILLLLWCLCGTVQGRCTYSCGSPAVCMLHVRVSRSSDLSPRKHSTSQAWIFMYVLRCSARSLRWHIACWLMVAGSGGSPCCLTHACPALAADRANPFSCFTGIQLRYSPRSSTNDFNARSLCRCEKLLRTHCGACDTE